MILYTVMPMEVVFGDDWNTEKDDRESPKTKTIEIDYLGEKVVVMPMSNNRFAIDRVISTSPKSYLNPKLQPGSIINGFGAGE